MVECNGLENRRAFTGTVGSNPTLSAIYSRSHKISDFLEQNTTLLRNAVLYLWSHQTRLLLKGPSNERTTVLPEM